jgi:hypothetical protein
MDAIYAKPPIAHLLWRKATGIYQQKNIGSGQFLVICHMGLNPAQY